MSKKGKIVVLGATGNLGAYSAMEFINHGYDVNQLMVFLINMVLNMCLWIFAI